MKYKSNTRDLKSIKKPSERRYFAEERWLENKEKRVWKNTRLKNNQKIDG